MLDILQSLFREVADLDPKARSRYLDEHQIAPQLRVELESLIRFDQNGADPITGVVGAAAEQFLASDPERRCGPYELVRLVGQGGMGSVYMAQRRDGEVNLRVAIKFIRAADTTPVFRDRFLKERQILASLNHPGITRLLDAGHTDSGQPYLVMEYVDGTPIDVHCRNFDFAAKLKLFLSVCDAIAYLHRNLVIHRDLKPSNILVEAGGTPKILDFGIAKILDDTADHRLTNERMLTPHYASPEQVRGTARTTATDVYSLGAVLYELLTGQSPHARADESVSIEEAICSVDPAPVDRLNPALPRDLTFIVRKALHKEPAERYATVDAFSDDLRAVLELRPVKVRSSDAWYRTRKFARRHRVPITAVVVAMLSLSAGLYAVNRERVVAQRRFAQVRQLVNRVLALDEQIRALPGSTKAREQMVSMSVEYLDALGREARNDVDLKLDAANGYMLTAQVQGVPIAPSLGHFKEAQTSLAKAAELVESVLATAPARADGLLLGSEIEQDRTIIADTLHDWPEALLHADRAVSYADRLTRIAGLSASQNRAAARIYMNVGQARMNMHRYAEAAVQIRRGIELARTAGASAGVIAQGLSALANALRQKGDLEGALATITEARALSETAAFPNETLRASALYAILWRQGVIFGDDESVSLNRPGDAIEPLQKAFDLVDREASKDPSDFSFRDRVGSGGQQLGDVLRHRDPARALDVYDRTLVRLREVRDSATARRQEARILAHASYALRALLRFPEAKQHVDQALEMLQTAADKSLGGEWDDAMRASAAYEAETGHPQRALDILVGLHSHLLTFQPDIESDLRLATDMSRLYASIAGLDAKLGNREQQITFETLRKNLWQRWDQRLPDNPFIRRQLESGSPFK